MRWWWRCIPGLHKKWKLENRRQRAVLFIARERAGVEEMAQRPRRDDDALNTDLRDKLTKQFDNIDKASRESMQYDQLGELMDTAEAQGQFRAYLCPLREVWIEGNLSIALMKEWGVPKSVIDSLHDLVDAPLKDAINGDLARGALRAIFEESDSWNDYTTDFADDMNLWTKWLFGLALAMSILAFISFFLPQWALPFGLLLAGASGSCVSVMTKMPTKEVSFSGQWDSFGRTAFTRLGAGIIASIMGCGLLASGALSISVDNQNFSNILCETCPHPYCNAVRALVLLAVPMLLGFSERALSTIERTVVGKPPRARKS